MRFEAGVRPARNFRKKLKKTKSFLQGSGSNMKNMGAMNYLGSHRNDSDVAAILKTAGLEPKLLKSWAPPMDMRQFRGTMSLYLPLLDHNLINLETFKVLFGPHAETQLEDAKSTLWMMGMDPSGANSVPVSVPGAGGYFSTPQARPAVCDSCGKIEGEDFQGKMPFCAGCKRARYCSTQCQKDGWTIHKPECLTKQGKKVPEKAREASERAFAEKRAKEAAAVRREREREIEEDRANFIQGDMSWDCEGNFREKDYPWSFTDEVYALAKQLGLSGMSTYMGYTPTCVDFEFDFDPNRQIEIEDPASNKSVHFLYTKLFEDEGLGNMNGIGFDGLFTGPEKKGEKDWKLVSLRPLSLKEIKAFLVKYLDK
jgi:hypothetical protein